MGTRSLVHIKEDGKTLVTLYRQFDGYPTGMGQDIFDALNNGKARLVNGYGSKDASPEVFNGMGCLAAYLVGALKRPVPDGTPLERTNPIGNVYVQKPDAKDCGEEYVYTLDKSEDTITLEVKRVYGGDVMYSGHLAKFDAEQAEKMGDDES